MEDREIIDLFWQRSEAALEETQQKYGAFCLSLIHIYFYSYYQYSGDEQLLKEKILPFMKEAADFYEAYLVRDEEDVYKRQIH